MADIKYLKAGKLVFVIAAILILFNLTLFSGCTSEKLEKKKEVKKEEGLEMKDNQKPENVSEKEESTAFTLISSAFQNGDVMPVRFAKSGVPGGENISPPLAWKGAPEGTKSLALICVDRHPVANNWIHWIVINIPASVQSLPEGASPEKIPEPAKELYNTYGNMGYGGPQPPPGTGVHDYEFTIYALSVEQLDIPSKLTLREFNQAIEGKVIDKATLIGKFSQ